jgi:hypothetical protein
MAASALASASLSARIPDFSQVTGLLDGFKTQAGGIQAPVLPLARIEELAGKFNIQVPDTSSWSSAIPSDVSQVLSALPDAAALAKPLAEPLARIQSILNFPLNDEVKRVEDAIAALKPASLDSPEAFLNGVLQPLSEVASFLQNSEALKLVGTIASFFGAKDVEKFPGQAAAAVSQLQSLLRDRAAAAVLAVTGLASASTSVVRTERLVQAIGSSFSLEATQARFQAVLQAYGDGADSLAAALAAPDFTGGPQADAIRARFKSINDSFVTFQVFLARDLAFSEASITVLDSGALQESLKQTAAALGKLDTAQLKALAASIRTAVEGFQKAIKVDPDLSLDQLKKLLADGLDQARTIIEKLDLTKVRDAIQGVMQTIEAPFTVLEDLKQTIETTVRSAMAGIKQALGRIDLSVVRKSAEQFLDQLGGKIGELEQVFTDVRTAIEDVLTQAAAELDGLKTFILDPQNGLKKKIEDVFHSVFSLLDSLNIKGVIDEVSGILQPISVDLGKIEFAPVFNATTDVIGTINGVLQTVAPLLVTDDLKKKLGDATAFLRKIDFDQIAGELNGVFDGILSAVNEDALGAIKEEYKKVVDAIDNFDPTPVFESLQKEVFDPLIAELDKVKPAELLKPVQDGFNTVMEALRKFDPAQSLAFATKFFNDLLARFHELSPEKLVQPLEAALGDIKTRIEQVLMVDKALDALNQVTGFLQPVIEAINVESVLDEISKGFEAFKAELAVLDPAGLFAPVKGLLDTAFSGAGVILDAEGILEALQAVANRGAKVEDRLAALPPKLSAAAAEINKLDLDASLATLRARHGAVAAALASHDGTSAVQIEFSLRVTALDPVPILTPMAARTATLRSTFADKAAAFDTAVTSLKSQLQPVSNIRDALASFLDAFGMARDLIANPFRQLTGQASSTREAIMHFADELNPANWRAQLEPVLTSLHGKIKEILSDVVLNPIAEAVCSLKSITGLLDISTLIQPVTEVFEDVEQTINQLNPAPIIEALDAKYKELLGALEKLNPAQFIAEIQKLYTDDLLGVLKAVSPKDLLLPPLHELFDKIKGLLVSIDVEVLFKPILDRLKILKTQLADGLGSTGNAYKQMLATLDSAGGGVSVSMSVTS